MTIQSPTARASFVCNNVSTVFPVNIQAYLATDFLVLVTNAAGSIVLTLNSDYTLVASGSLAPPFWSLTTQTGQLVSPYVTGNTLQVILNPAETQLSQYTQGQAFPSLAVQTNLDRLTQMAIRQTDILARAIVAPDGDVSPVMALPSAVLRASKNLGFDPSGNLAVNLALASGTISTATLAPFLNLSQTPAEAAVSVIPVNLQYPQGHLYRYGTNTTPGTTDMTSAVQSWALVGGQLTMPVPETVLINNTITLQSNTTVSIVPGALFKMATANLSVFKATGKSNIVVQGGAIQQTVNGATTHIGLVEFNTCTNCNANNLELIGAQWSGILLSASNNCTVRANYVHNSLGCTTANVDSHDISCYLASSFNVIEGNQCFGGTAAEHGIMMLSTGTPNFPTKNVVIANRVGPHSSYGILNYLFTDHANTYCTICDNYIEGITGTSQGGSSGAGIYNQGAGGTVIANNNIRNCCISSSNETLLPAGIALNLDAAFEPVNVTGNVILDMANYNGIEVVNGPANIVGNTIRFSAGVLAFRGIYVNAANNVNVQSNFVNIDSSIANSRGIFAIAQGVSISNINISGNTIQGCASRQLWIETSGAFTTTNLTVSANNCSGGGVACIPILLDNVVLAAVSGNTASANTVNALNATACTQTRFTGNSFTTTGTAAVATAGTCTGSYYDKSNFSNTGLVNAATGMICEQLGSATPISGFNSAVGDRIEQSVPVVGNPKGWRCTASGNPGTWVSEGNL